MIEKLKMEQSPLSAMVEKIKEICPAAVTRDGKIDFDALKTSLGTDVAAEQFEKYEFTWVGKNSAKVEANRPIRKTLRPVVADSRNWDTTQNLYIEGDNLDALKLLQESYLGKVKMIYIDPPYNTGNDFVYCDNFTAPCADYLENKGQCDEEGNRLFKNTETNGRFHSDWCSMIYPRLKIARDLLSEDGVIFISIDDHEQANLKKICDEVFGEDNFVACVTWKNKFGAGALTAGFIGVHEYIFVYSKKPIVNITRALTNTERADYNKSRDAKFDTRGGYVTQPLAVTTFGDRPNLRYPIAYNGQEIWPKKQWVWEKDRMLKAIENDEVVFNLQKDGTYNLRSKKYLKDEYGKERRGKPTTVYSEAYTQNGTEDIRDLFEKLVFEYTKPVQLLKYLFGLEINNQDSANDIILDFFSGSATTAHAVMQLNAEDGGSRRFIMVQLPEKTDEKSEAYKAGYKNICEIGKERIRRAGDKIKAENPDKDLDVGFRVLRVDSTNMKDVYYNPSDTAQSGLLDSVDNIKNDRSDLDLLFGVMVDCGLPLDYPIETRELDGKKYYVINGNDLVACFETNIPEKLIYEIANIKPLCAVFRDSSFVRAADKINLSEIFKNITGDDDRVRVL